jgi:ParB family chromosome partitioning protein
MALNLQDLSLGKPKTPAAPNGEPLRLDPKTIRASRWANRAAQSFESPEFVELKAEIADAGGNVQPIKVRPLAVPDGAVRYEIVFGHRRHRACLDLGLQITAVVESVDDQKLWAQMERENRSRANLSAWEQGMMYQRALEENLFPSMNALAKAIGRDQGDVSRAIAIAKLPEAVLSAFPSPNDVRFRDAKPLGDAVAAAPEAVIAAAQVIAKEPDKRPAVDVVKALTQAAEGGYGPSITPAKTPSKRSEKASQEPSSAPDKPLEKRLKIAGKSVVIADDAKGAVVRFAPGMLSHDKWPALEAALKKLFTN